MYDWAEFRHFRYLLAISKKGGFRVAADELHTSQPNLTVQARQFQENASIRLFRNRKTAASIQPERVRLPSIAPLLFEVRDEIMDASSRSSEAKSIQCDSDQRHSSIRICFAPSVNCTRN